MICLSGGNACTCRPFPGLGTAKQGDYVAAMSFEVIDLRDGLPPQFEALRARAEAEDYLFLNRLATRWNDGAYEGDTRASLRAVFDNDAIIAVGAQTVDEYDPHPDHRRIRHFYVSPNYRRHGVGRRLAEALTDDAFMLAPRLHLRAMHALSTAFWDAMGFERVERPDRTHVKVRS
jgi:GNAT superfamily N-acetyltransferase